MYFDHAFPSLYFPHMLLTSLPTQVHICSFSRVKIQTQKYPPPPKKRNMMKNAMMKLKHPGSKDKQSSKQINKLWHPFCVGQLLLSMGLSLTCSYIPRETPLEKADFPLVSEHQLEIASGIRWKLVSISLFQ